MKSLRFLNRKIIPNDSFYFSKFIAVTSRGKGQQADTIVIRKILSVLDQAYARGMTLGKFTYTQMINAFVWYDRMDMAWKYFHEMETRTDFGGADIVVYNILLKGITWPMEELFNWLKKMDEKGIK